MLEKERSIEKKIEQMSFLQEEDELWSTCKSEYQKLSIEQDNDLFFLEIIYKKDRLQENYRTLNEQSKHFLLENQAIAHQSLIDFIGCLRNSQNKVISFQITHNALKGKFILSCLGSYGRYRDEIISDHMYIDIVEKEKKELMNIDHVNKSSETEKSLFEQHLLKLKQSWRKSLFEKDQSRKILFD